jgi:hypothetical protein
MNYLQGTILAAIIIVLALSFLFKRKALRYKTEKYPKFSRRYIEWFKQSPAEKRQWFNPQGWRYVKLSGYLASLAGLILVVYILFMR